MSSFPELLLQAASRAQDSNVKTPRNAMVGCVIVRSDGAVVSAKNGYSTNVEPQHHAEARCLRKSDYDGVAFVARIRRDGTLGCAKPCPSCERKLKSKGVRIVHYTNGSNEWCTMDLTTGEIKTRVVSR